MLECRYLRPWLKLPHCYNPGSIGMMGLWTDFWGCHCQNMPCWPFSCSWLRHFWPAISCQCLVYSLIELRVWLVRCLHSIAVSGQVCHHSCYLGTFHLRWSRYGTVCLSHLTCFDRHFECLENQLRSLCLAERSEPKSWRVRSGT